MLTPLFNPSETEGETAPNLLTRAPKKCQHSCRTGRLRSEAFILLA